ncbi:MAG: hypothetical protein EAZ06_08175 [Cytophagales bacterium]|nr:MAG: hypothetical protein EAZ06_08175 [Cytophagales bacterium]
MIFFYIIYKKNVKFYVFLYFAIVDRSRLAETKREKNEALRVFSLFFGSVLFWLCALHDSP